MSSSATNLYNIADNNSENAHRTHQISDQKVLFSTGPVSRGASISPCGDLIEAKVDGSFPSLQHSEVPVNTYQPALPTTYYSEEQTQGSYVYNHRASSVYRINSNHPGIYQQGCNFLPYSMQRWRDQDRYEDPYHAFVAIGCSQQGPGVIAALDTDEGPEAEEQLETEATWRSERDNAQRST
jgi:hypothetical protein